MVGDVATVVNSLHCVGWCHEPRLMTTARARNRIPGVVPCFWWSFPGWSCTHWCPHLNEKDLKHIHTCLLMSWIHTFWDGWLFVLCLIVCGACSSCTTMYDINNGKPIYYMILYNIEGFLIQKLLGLFLVLYQFFFGNASNTMGMHCPIFCYTSLLNFLRCKWQKNGKPWWWRLVTIQLPQTT